MASIYREGKGWSARVRLKGKSAYEGGFARKEDANNWARKMETAFCEKKTPKGMGLKTPLALALRSYVFDEVIYHKGCKPELARINPYLESVDLPLLEATAVPIDAEKDVPVLFSVVERPASERKLPRTFEDYRAARLEKRPRTALQRKRLAAMAVGDIAVSDIKELKNAMVKDQFSRSSINNELSILSAFFTYAFEVWEWSPLDNPCSAVKRPQVNNKRNRVLSASEQVLLASSLNECTNPYVAPFVWFAIETAMRKSEILLTARWKDVNWERRVLCLGDAKNGGREVPLTKAAVALLESLPRFDTDGLIFPVTANAIDSAWERACSRAGITNLRIHDLRHTAATRHAKRLNGDIFLLQLITGHKTLSMLHRYVNQTVDDAVVALDATEPSPGAKVPEPMRAAEVPVPARPKARKLVRICRRRRKDKTAVPEVNSLPDTEHVLAANVLRVDFSRRTAA